MLLKETSNVASWWFFPGNQAGRARRGFLFSTLLFFSFLCIDEWCRSLPCLCRCIVATSFQLCLFGLSSLIWCMSLCYHFNADMVHENVPPCHIYLVLSFPGLDFSSICNLFVFQLVCLSILVLLCCTTLCYHTSHDCSTRLSTFHHTYLFLVYHHMFVCMPATHAHALFSLGAESHSFN